MEELLAKLVAMPTISEDITANTLALDFIEDYLGERGMDCSRFVFGEFGTLLATTQPGSRKPRVTLYAHVDVVPGTEQVFRMRREGNKLLGRGTYDMKFALAAYMVAVDQLQKELQNYDFSILIVSNEEIGGRGGIICLESFLQQEPYETQVCLMPDGAYDWNIEGAAKGWWRFQLTAIGKATHSSRPWEGESASFKLIQALHELREHFAAQGPETDTLNIGKIHGGDAYNQVPSLMVARVEIRLAHETSLQKNQAYIASLCNKYGLEIETESTTDLLRQDTSHPLIQEYLAAVEEVVGYRPKECLSNGGSDASYFNAKGVPCILTYLPGGGHHSEGEWVSRSDFLAFLPVVHTFLERTAKVR